MKPIFPNVTIIGLGLIGGSIALDLKRNRLAHKVVGVSATLKNREAALKRKAVDEAYPSVGDFISQSDLVIIATPVGKIIPLLQQVRKHLKSGALVTDVGSVKGEIVRQAARLRNVNFIGGHPIAGTEKSGMKSAERGLFRKKKWILTPTAQVSSVLRRKLLRWVRALGAEGVIVDSAEHDRIFSAVSHLPNLLGYALANTVDMLKDRKTVSMAGSSLRDMTRVAASPPEMWRDICIANRADILRMLRLFEVELEKFKKAVDQGYEARLYRLFEKGNKFREKL